MLLKLLKKRSRSSVKCESLGVCLTALIQSEGAGGVQATTCREMPLCCELRAESWERGLLYWRWTFEKMSRGAARKTQRRKKTDEIRTRRHMRAVFFVKVEHFFQSSLLENLSQGSVALSQNKFGQCVIHHIRKTNFLRASWSWRWGNGGRLSWWRKLWSGSSVVVAA